MREVRLHPDAVEEAHAAWLRYRELRQELADDFAVRFDRATAAIAARPASFPPDRDGVRRCRMSRFPYALVFVASERFIDLVAVAHTRRRPGYWRTRRIG